MRLSPSPTQYFVIYTNNKINMTAVRNCELNGTLTPLNGESWNFMY